MKKETLFHRDFTMMIIGQIASLFGNAIVRFALSLYVLDKTGSAAVFGSILAVSMIPTILISPVGGMIADRVNRRNIMVLLDFSTAVLVFSFSLLFGRMDDSLLVGVLMVMLSIIQACYQPAVTSSIPVLVAGESLMRANGLVIQVNALANLVGPILGGAFYGLFGLTPLVWASAVCFFLSAVMELFLHIPFVRQPKTAGAVSQAKKDFEEALCFLTKENPHLFRLLLVIAALNLFLTPVTTVGLPYLMKVYLGLSDTLYGFSQGALAIGSIVGGMFSGFAAKRLRFSQSHILLVLSSLCLIPVILSVTTNAQPLLSYVVILAAIVAFIGFATLFNIFAQTYAQQQTPNRLLGKVASVITVVSVCATPIGQAIYGVLFDVLHSAVFSVVLIACLSGVLLSCLTRRFLKQCRD